MAINFEVKADKVLQKLSDIKEKKANAIQSAVVRAGFFVEGEVKESVAGRRGEPTSVDTGRFLQSISSRSDGFGQATVFTEVEYAKYLEEGTRYIDARQHFSNTVARNKDKVTLMINEAIKDII